MKLQPRLGGPLVSETMGVDHREGGQVPPEFGAGGLSPPPDFVMLQNFKQQITCIQCRKMCCFASTAGLL